MAQQVTLAAQRRTATGKGAARTLRRAGKVPAVIYGHGRDPESLELDAALLGRALTGATGATVVDVSVDGAAPVKALFREVQRSPLRSADIVHVDLYEIRGDEAITVSVPIHVTGTADGVRNFGGVLDQVMREVEIEVLPADIPEHVVLEITDLAIGHSRFVRDLVIPNARIMDEADRVVVTVVAPRTEETVAPVAAEAAPAEPELIRKPKAEGEEPEAEKA